MQWNPLGSDAIGFKPVQHCLIELSGIEHPAIGRTWMRGIAYDQVEVSVRSKQVVPAVITDQSESGIKVGSPVLFGEYPRCFDHRRTEFDTDKLIHGMSEDCS